VQAGRAREALHAAGEREQTARLLRGLFVARQARLHLESVASVMRLQGWKGMSFANSSVRVAPFHDADDVAQPRRARTSCRRWRKRFRWGRHGWRASFCLSTRHAVRARARRSRGAKSGSNTRLRVSGRLEEQVVAQGVQIGDAERTPQTSAGARAAHRAAPRLPHAVRLPQLRSRRRLRSSPRKPPG